MFAEALSVVSKIFKPAAELVDNVHTSDEEKLSLKNALVSMQNEVVLAQLALIGKQMDLEKSLLESQSAIINAEASSESFIARNWRPITMLTFVAIIVLHSLGYVTLETKFAEKFMDLVQIGLGGYVIGRSLEKTAPSIAKAVRG